MSDPAVAQDPPAYQKLAREAKEICADRRALPLLQGRAPGARQGPGDGQGRDRPGAARDGARGGARPRGQARRARRRDPAAARPQGPERRQERAARDPGRHGRRRGGALRRRGVPDVPALRGAAGLEGRRRLAEPHRPGRHQGSDRDGRGRPRVLEAALRERRPPRPARAGDRGLGPDPHLGDHGGRAPGGRRGRRQDRAEGPARRHLLLLRPRRPERQHHLLGGAHHAPAHEHGRLLPGREEPDQEPREGA